MKRIPRRATDWTTAAVEGGRLTVELPGESPRGRRQHFEGVVALLDQPGGRWGPMTLTKNVVSVADVHERHEAELRHLLESVALQVNADLGLHEAPAGERGEGVESNGARAGATARWPLPFARSPIQRPDSSRCNVRDRDWFAGPSSGPPGGRSVAFSRESSRAGGGLRTERAQPSLIVQREEPLVEVERGFCDPPHDGLNAWAGGDDGQPNDTLPADVHDQRTLHAVGNLTPAQRSPGLLDASAVIRHRGPLLAAHNADADRIVRPVLQAAVNHGRGADRLSLTTQNRRRLTLLVLRTHRNKR